MPAMKCPQCQLPAGRAVGKAFCPHCGWNRGEAEKQTRLFLRVLPVLVMIFDAPLLVWIFVGHAELSALAGLFILALVPAVLVVLVVRGKAKIGAPGRGSERSL